MLNTTVPAAGEAMPAANINRRQMLTGIAAIPAYGLAAVIPVAAVAVPAHSDDPQHDPKVWIALWRGATPEAQWEALRILRAATVREAKAVKS